MWLWIRLLFIKLEGMKIVEGKTIDIIEKACEWLKENVDKYGVPESESGKVFVDDLVEDFRKEMNKLIV